MSETVIKVQDLSKQYRLGQIGTGSLAHDVNRWWHTVRGKEDPYLKVGEVNDRTKTATSQYVWSLKDVNFEIKQGDAVGIIGRNGAGKSTLLKVLSRVTVPTTGSVKVKGRIASLLEVGTGFHPELSGRDNIFLNGAILGMRKHEVQRKFDEIVDFAGVERYIDTPVKRYSSGMYVRLAFAVAAYLESEILIVDEVLAVGDAEFQKKCLGKMSDVSKGEGRTVLFVSHNMAAVNALCNSGILLSKGTVLAHGLAKNIVDQYISLESTAKAFVEEPDIKITRRTEAFKLKSVGISNGFGFSGNIKVSDPVSCILSYEVLEDDVYCVPSIHLLDIYGTCILVSFNADSVNAGTDKYFGVPLKRGRYTVTCTIPANFLNEGQYSINVLLSRDIGFKDFVMAEEVITFEAVETGEMRKEYTGPWLGIVRPKLFWETELIS